MRISDWSSDVCSSDLTPCCAQRFLDTSARLLRRRQVAWDVGVRRRRTDESGQPLYRPAWLVDWPGRERAGLLGDTRTQYRGGGYRSRRLALALRRARQPERHHADLSERSEEHTSELQSL